MLTVNALVAADSVLIPMQCEYYALEGLSALVATIEQIRDAVNPQLEIEGILRTMFDPRNNLANEVSAQLIMHFGDKVFRTIIPRNMRLAEAPVVRQAGAVPRQGVARRAGVSRARRRDDPARGRSGSSRPPRGETTALAAGSRASPRGVGTDPPAAARRRSSRGAPARARMRGAASMPPARVVRRRAHGRRLRAYRTAATAGDRRRGALRSSRLAGSVRL